MLLSIASLAGFTGCFTPEPASIEIETLAFSNDYTTRTDLVLRPFHYAGLTCPDGEPATFYTIYGTELDPVTPVPIVIFFHSGSFDYVESRSDGTVPAFDSDEAVHYQGENRLTMDWAADKVFETLGLLDETIDETEMNLGILPAKLADAGVFTMYPANCWGDLWHNETGARNNNWEADGGVHRDGRYLAWTMTAIANPDPDVALKKRLELGLLEETGEGTTPTIPVSLDASGVYIVGLGEGGRAAAELRIRDLLQDVPNQDATPVKGMVVDSHLDNLARLVAHDETFHEINDGIARIYPDHVDDDGDGVIEGDTTTDPSYRDDVEENIQAFSLYNAVYRGDLSYPLGVWYSSLDPQVPAESNYDLLEQYPEHADYMTVVDYGESYHTILNRDEAQADAAVALLLGR